MKNLLDKLLSSRKQKGNIGRRERIHLSELLFALSTQIPIYIYIEFQRKLFDLTDITNWKATQYRFMLLYAGGLILCRVMSPEMYRHVLLLFVACRILCSRTWAFMYTNDAVTFLRQFFKQMPKFYGKVSQSMNFHNLIHLADDVRNLQAPLTDYSSFPFENCLGNIKKLFRTSRNPVAQVFRRLSENQSDSLMIKKYALGAINCDHVRRNEHEFEANTVEYSKRSIKNMTIGVTKPGNVVKLANVDIFEIKRIFSANGNLDNIHIKGMALRKKGNAFNEPMASSTIGIYKIGSPFGSWKAYSLDNIVEKCLVLNVEARKYVVTYLRNS